MGFLRLPGLATRRSLRLAGIAAIAAMLFAQVALAIAACEVPGKPSRGSALSAAAGIEAPCHTQAPANDPLCLAHCQASDASLDKAHAPVGVPPAAALPSIPFLPFMESGFQRIPEGLPPASPPARILFRTLLI